MTPAAAENAVIQAFKAWWDASAYAGTPMAYPDIVFDIPADPPWGRLTFTWSGSFVVGSGAMKEDRHTGFITVELFWPQLAGFKDVGAAAEAVRAFFRDLVLDSGRLQCKGIGDGARPYVTKAPAEPGFTRRIVNVPVRLHELR